MQSKEQQRAKSAYTRIENTANSFQGDEKSIKTQKNEYGSMAHKLPVIIRSAGLAQALAFVNSRGKNPHHALLDDIAHTLSNVNNQFSNLNNRDSLAERSHKAQLSEYMKLTQEILAICLWYKRFAESILEVESGESNDGS